MASEDSTNPATMGQVANEQRQSPAASLISKTMTLNEVSGESVYIGGMLALNHPDNLTKLGITHIVTAIKMQPVHRSAVHTDGLDEFKRLTIEVDDVENENMLVYFQQAYEFISSAVEGGGRVFIHCGVGVSRSATILTAYLMKKYKLNPSEALEKIRKDRPGVEPNAGFMEQLALYQQMDYAEDIEDHVVYQRWMYKREVDQSIAQGMAPRRIHFRDQEKEVSRIASGSAEVGAAEKNIELRCKKCRRVIATSKDITPHEPKQIINDQDLAYRQVGKPTPCAHYFVEPLLWMEPELTKGELSGKLECPKCKCKLGSYAWQGSKCSCGEWVIPGISVARGRVDEVKIPVAR